MSKKDAPTTLGMDVRMRFRPESIYGAESQTLHNVTEIHYGYPSYVGEPVRVAFESDVHSCGFTYDAIDIAEFEAVPAQEVAETM